MKKVKLTSICRPKQWKTIPTSDLKSSGYPVYGANGVIGYYEEYNHECSTIAITCRGATCGTVNLTAPKAYITGNAMCLDTVSDSIELKYLYYALQAFDFSRIISGTAQPQITREGLQKVEIPLPEIPEQQKIIALLDEVSYVMCLRLQQMEEMDLLVKSRFIEMFGDPVVNPYGYDVCTLQEMIENNIILYHLDGNHGGDYPRSEEFVESGVPYIGANCISEGTIDFSHAKYLIPERAAKLRKGIAVEGDVLFAHNATVGPVAVLHTTEEKVILSTSLTAYRCNQSMILPDYLKTYMQSDGFVRQYSSDMKQTTRNQVPITAQKKYLFIVPPVKLQQQFSNFVQATDKSKYHSSLSLEHCRLLAKHIQKRKMTCQTLNF